MKTYLCSSVFIWGYFVFYLLLLVETLNESPPLHFRSLEIDQQANRPPGSPKVIQTLGRMFLRKSVGALQFNQQSIFDDDIHKVLANSLILVSDFQWNLTHSPNTAQLQFPQQRTFINLFQKSAAQSIGDFEGSAQNLLAQQVNFPPLIRCHLSYFICFIVLLLFFILLSGFIRVNLGP